MPNQEKNDIIMSIHVHPNWKTNANSKNGRKTSFSYEAKASKSFIPTTKMWLWCPIIKTKDIVMWIHVYPNWKTNFNSKNVRKTSFSYETKASKSFFSMRRMWLWHPIMKRKEIIMWIHIYPYGKMNFDSKNGWKTSFSYEIKASKSFISMKRIWLWCPIMKKKDIIMRIHVYLIERQT